MNNKKYIMLALVVGLCAAAYGDKADEPNKIRIYLPSEKTLTSEVIQMGEVAIVLGDDELVQRANQISLGQFAVNGQEITIDRRTILSRLAASGIKASSVVFNGAETISVRRDEDFVAADRFVAAARDYLRQQLSDEQIETLKLIRPVKDYPLDGGEGPVTLTALASHRRSNRMKYVTVQVIRNGVELGCRELTFSVQYSCPRLVAKRTLAAGTQITPENTVVEKYMSNVPVQGAVSLPYGMIAKRDIAGGTTITKTMTEYRKPPVLVKRNQKVILKLDTGGLFVSVPGEAAEDGRVGDIISVQRGSRRTNDLKIVQGEVMSDGTVRPIL